MNPKSVARKLLPKRVIQRAEASYRKGRAHTLQVAYGFPARKLRVIGVTGTNGKTTTCALINTMLKKAGYKTAMFTTAIVEMDGEQTMNTLHKTVPDTSGLLAFLKMAKQKKVDFVVLELTSHALDQHKVSGIPIEVAVMTNLTQDHLDYHGSMEAYAASKARLFNDYCKPKVVVLNRDDRWYEYFYSQAVGKTYSYGFNQQASLPISDQDLTSKGSSFKLAFKADKLSFKTRLPGKFNLYNAAAAASVGLLLGIEPTKVAEGIHSLAAVPGRMETVDEGQNFGVIVDYAHGPDALANVLATLQEVTKGRVIAVFGATGDRDKSKRPIMGQVAAKQADLIFLTDDEVYSEDPDAIRQAVYGGIVAAGGDSKTTVIPDRRQAIKAAFSHAKPGDVVLLAGIGHQDYRVMGNGKVVWDERQVARQILLG